MKYQAKRRLRRTVFFVIVGLIILACAGFAFSRISAAQRASTALYSLPADAGRVYEAQGGYAAIQGQILTRLDEKAKPLFSVDLGIPDMKACGTKNQTAVYGGNTLYIYDNNGTMLVQHTLEATILDMVLGEEAYALIIEAEGQRKVSVYAIDTSPRDENILFPYQSVLDVGLFDDDRQLWTLSLDVHATQPMSMVKTRNIGLTTTASLSVEGEVVYRVEPYENGFVTVGTQNIRHWDSKGSEVFSQMIYGWVLQDMEVDARGRMQFLLCPADVDGSGVHSMMWYLRLEEDGTTTQYRCSLPADTRGCCFTDEDIAALTTTKLYRLPYQGGTTTSRDLPVAIDDFTMMQEHHAIIVRAQDTEYLLNLG